MRRIKVMKTIIFINNVYHNYNKDRLMGEILQLEWYCKRKNREIHKVMIANNEEELENIKEYLTTTNDLDNGDGVLTLEISDISVDDKIIKEFVLSLCSRGIKFRAFHEYFNNKNEKEKDILLGCLDIFISISR